jgi:hypothetical protein
MTEDDFRGLALSLPEATEAAHMGHPDFRVHGKIFATLWPKDRLGMVKLTPEQQAQYTAAEPLVFVAVKGGWGQRGCTNVRLAAASSDSVHSALLTAWRNVAPKRLVQEHDAPP